MFKVNDKVKWFDSTGKGANKIYSMFPNYGKIARLTPKYADIIDSNRQKIVRVLQSELIWD